MPDRNEGAAHYDAVMRTTVTLPDKIHERAMYLARDSGRSLSEVISSLLQDALDGRPDPTIRYDSLTGLPYVRVGRTITSEEIRALDDDE